MMGFCKKYDCICIDTRKCDWKLTITYMDCTNNYYHEYDENGNAVLKIRDKIEHIIKTTKYTLIINYVPEVLDKCKEE